MIEGDINMRDGPVGSVEASPRSRRTWMRALLGLLSPAGSRGRLTILVFHRVHALPDAMFPGEMHAATFRERMGWIREWFNVLPLDEAVTALSRGTLPARALAITFDDGYADNYTVALPILQQLQLPATFFVATGFLDGGRMWNDTVIETVRAAQAPALDLSSLSLGVHRIDSPEAQALAVRTILSGLKYLSPPERQQRVDAIAGTVADRLPMDLMLSSEQVRGLAAAGMGIGAHTVTHPILARLDDPTARREIADGRIALEGLAGQPIRLFAYPNGKPGNDYTSAHATMVKELGFTAAVSTSWGVARTADSLFELPRFTPWGVGRVRYGLRMAQNLTRKSRAVA
jgi:peptidoglycan/xylan/chitin deacetylase (PgdA/CDA1 family)